MADDTKEPWLNYLALTTVILAVCATLATFKGSSYSTRSVMSQSQASDQWAFFQAKSVKGHLHEIQNSQLELEVKAFPPSSTELIAAYKTKVSDNSKKLERYEREKKQIQEEAHRLEELRDNYQHHSGEFAFSVIFLQIAILLNSLAGLFRKKWLWLTSTLPGVVGIIYFANGFLLFF